jgi:6-pyruvoyltetrahydropterin/6-carboxytetrahydropterin synthase
MTTVKIGKRYSFDAAHQLVGHNGKCASLHGHTYVVEVWLKGEQLYYPGASSNGMLLDYADLDAVVKPLIDAMDHSFIAEGHEPAKPAWNAPSKIYDVGIRTTSENLAWHIWKHVVDNLPNQGARITLIGVIVSETPKTYAEFIGAIYA